MKAKLKLVASQDNPDQNQGTDCNVLLMIDYEKAKEKLWPAVREKNPGLWKFLQEQISETFTSDQEKQNELWQLWTKYFLCQAFQKVILGQKILGLMVLNEEDLKLFAVSQHLTKARGLEQGVIKQNIILNQCREYLKNIWADGLIELLIIENEMDKLADTLAQKTQIFLSIASFWYAVQSKLGSGPRLEYYQPL